MIYNEFGHRSAFSCCHFVNSTESRTIQQTVEYLARMRRRPDLHKLLCGDWPHMRPFADQGTANRDQPVGEIFYMPVRPYKSMLRQRKCPAFVSM